MDNEFTEEIFIPVSPYDFSDQYAGNDRLGNQLTYGQRVTNLRTLLFDNVGPTTDLNEVILEGDKDNLSQEIEDIFEIETERLRLSIGEEKILEQGGVQILLRRNSTGYTFEMINLKSRGKAKKDYFIPGIHPINWYHTIPNSSGSIIVSNTEGHEEILVSKLQLKADLQEPRTPEYPYNFVDTYEDIKAAIANKFKWLTEEDMRLAQNDNAYIEELERQIAQIMQIEKHPKSTHNAVEINGVNISLIRQLYGPAVDVFDQIGRGRHEISYLAHYDYFSLVETASRYYGIPVEDLSPAERQEFAFDFLFELEERIKSMEDILRKYEQLALGYSPTDRRLSEKVSERFIIDDRIAQGYSGFCYQGQDAIVLNTSQMPNIFDNEETANHWIEMLAEIALHERGHLLSHIAQDGFKYEEIFTEARVHVARALNPRNSYKYFVARYDKRIAYNEGVPYLVDEVDTPQGAEKLAEETIFLAQRANEGNLYINGRKLTGDEVISSMIGTSASRRLYSTDDKTSKLKPRGILFGDLYDLTHEIKFDEAFTGCTDPDYLAYKDELIKASHNNELTPRNTATLNKVETFLINRGIICPKEFGD